MSTTFLEWFRSFLNATWDFFSDFMIFNDLSLKSILVSFLLFSAVLGFVFKKLIPTGD